MNNDELATTLVYCRVPAGTSGKEVFLAVENVGNGNWDYSVCSWAVFRGLPYSAAIGDVQTGTNTTGNPSIVDPTLNVGYLAVAVGGIDDDGVTFTEPSGWTMATQEKSSTGTNTNNSSLAIAYRTDHSEGTQGTVSFSSTGDDYNKLHIAQFT